MTTRPATPEGKSPKQRVLAEIERRYGKRIKPRVCVTGRDKLLYLVIGLNTTIGIGKTARAAWADAARRI